MLTNLLKNEIFSQSFAEFFAEFRKAKERGLKLLRNSAFHQRDSA
jgi:hypothetical protein